MSVLSYLTELSSTVTIADWERTAIDTSIRTLSTKLDNYFDNIESKFVFGSYDRKTILRRSKDANSDIDYMVSFTDGSDWTPQTLMNRLKRFAEAKYSSNEIYQSSPTIVLELSHIKFELVPAYQTWGTYHIPAPASSYSTWINSYPNAMRKNLNDKNRDNNYQIRKLVRLLKYWNVQNGKVYTSYELEKYVIDKFFFFCTNLKDYFFQAVEGLSTYGLPYYKESKVNSLKTIVANTKKYEQDNMPYTAESEIKKAFE
ncbi:nucleotidyltransferase [Olleya sp. ITB9]|uniref:SMODS domain-containing nucleotidyltransferase n=1 Tax=Olleya sp. ITB9 TaxID=1715648 RepID=UPI000AC9F524|nr:nucleotidyltransferase [Olleya sp. ITB9]